MKKCYSLACAAAAVCVHALLFTLIRSCRDTLEGEMLVGEVEYVPACILQLCNIWHQTKPCAHPPPPQHTVIVFST